MQETLKFQKTRKLGINKKGRQLRRFLVEFAKVTPAKFQASQPIGFNYPNQHWSKRLKFCIQTNDI